MTTMTAESIIIRPFNVESDKSFILASWLRGLFYGGSWFSEIPKDVFMYNYHDFLENLLASSRTTVKIACLESDNDVIIGYAVFASQDNALHWVHIKKNFRKIGVAKKLIPESTKTATHANKVGMSIIKTLGWSFNPFLT
jgi:hypothetical protein